MVKSAGTALFCCEGLVLAGGVLSYSVVCLALLFSRSLVSLLSAEIFVVGVFSSAMSRSD